MKFRKKPVVVEAEQFTFDHVTRRWPLPAGVTREETGDAGRIVGAIVRFFVTTAHGQKADVQVNDWIIAEPDGRGHYPCKPDIFAATYDPVEGA